MIKELRTKQLKRAIVTVATGEYKQYVPELVETAQKYFDCHIYLFTDSPDNFLLKNEVKIGGYQNMTIIKVPHLGWPKTPLLRWEMFDKNKKVFKERYIFMLDADTRFMRHIYNDESVNGYRVGVLHRNITRYRKDFNYESRVKSTAYVKPDEGEKYYACGFCGGQKEQFLRLVEYMVQNIKQDAENGIRAIWGDESHINRYFINNTPTLTLPPSFMCPETNVFFVPFIQHRDKSFKRVEKEDAEKYLTINPKDYKNVI